MAGDAVLIAPVSMQIPRKQEFYRESVDSGSSETRPLARKRCGAAPFKPIPCAN
jgi:hypothetical protein